MAWGETPLVYCFKWCTPKGEFYSPWEFPRKKVVIMNYKTEKNKFGISVNKGCISCEHGCNNGRERRCQNLNAADYAQKVKKDHVCDCWRMKRGLQAAGRGDGKVKRKSYLLALLESTDSRESIQKEYEKKFGSIYLINK